MKDIRWQIYVGLGLVALSAALYILHFFIFHDAEHIWIYLLGDIAFLPIEVLLVTLVIHQLLENRDRQAKLEKLNMVIGTFFSDAGTELLTYFSDNDPHLEDIRRDLIIPDDWSDDEFHRVNNRLRAYSCDVNIHSVDLRGLKQFLTKKEDLFLRMLENPTLLEHESFTELLRAVFHLTEELNQRKDLSGLPETDLAHLSGDIKRVYGLLVTQWLMYMKYLKDNYPYLFSLAMRTNPFDESAIAIVE
jgi:hypothetical protein